MADDLIELHERVAFCRSEIVVLEREVKEFLSSSVSVRKQFKSEDLYDVFVCSKEPVPVRIRARAGIIANELRSCLDSLACTLAVRNGRSTKDVYFPASKSKEIFEDNGMKRIAKLSSADQATIISLKPYKGGNGGLFALHTADLTRKHLRLAASAASHSASSLKGIVNVRGSANITIGEITLGNEVVTKNFSFNTDRLTLDTIGTESMLVENVPVSVPFETDLCVAYQEPPELSGKDILVCLVKFADLVDSIVTRFD